LIPAQCKNKKSCLSLWLSENSGFNKHSFFPAAIALP
jgi:hypothetical protein